MTMFVPSRSRVDCRESSLQRPVLTRETCGIWACRRRFRSRVPRAADPVSQRLLPAISILSQSLKQRRETRVTFQRREALIR